MKKASIQFQLFRMQIITAGAVLLACTIAFMVNDFQTVRRGAINDLRSTARILGVNLISTITFLDSKEASKILESLRSDPKIVAAVVLDSQKKTFAQYNKQGTAPAPVSEKVPDRAADKQADGWVEFTTSGIHLYYPLKNESDTLGTLVLTATNQLLWAEYQRYAWIVLAVLFLGGLISVGFAQYFQRLISRPISSLVGFLRRVSGADGYSLRVGVLEGKNVPVEIQTLAAEFDRMLTNIQERDRIIHAANESLEKKVRERTEELKKVQAIALENAHAAGMAEVTNGILHNIGNIMNSVNLAVDELGSIVGQSKVDGLLKANEILLQHRDHLADFLNNDPKGKALVEYYFKLGENLRAENQKLHSEVEHLTKNVSMVQEVIIAQQSYARGRVFLEETNLRDIVEEVLGIQRTSLAHHGVQVIKHLVDTPPIKVQKVKLAHVLVNLIKNGKEAVSANPKGERTLTVENGRDQLGTFLRISDNGIGVSQENLDKIFNHGFTTKAEGHGFGLHFCANALAEMGGGIDVSSDGAGKGTVFTLRFELKREAA